MIQAIWNRGKIPEQMSWMIVVLLPKGGGDFRGIGLLDPFWKVVEKGKAGTATGMDGARAIIPGLCRPEEDI